MNYLNGKEGEWRKERIMKKGRTCFTPFSLAIIIVSTSMGSGGRTAKRRFGWTEDRPSDRPTDQERSDCHQSGGVMRGHGAWRASGGQFCTCLCRRRVRRPLTLREMSLKRAAGGKSDFFSQYRNSHLRRLRTDGRTMIEQYEKERATATPEPEFEQGLDLIYLPRLWKIQ